MLSPKMHMGSISGITLNLYKQYTLIRCVCIFHLQLPLFPRNNKFMALIQLTPTNIYLLHR